MQESTTEVEKSGIEAAPTKEAPKNVLFGSISYSEEANYEKFIREMTPQQALFVLVASANYAQAKGSFNLLESETLASAIRTLRKGGDAKPEETTTEPQPETEQA
jgi:hypothetical protein